MKTGVYLLMQSRKVVYVGSTTRWPARLNEHKEIAFDSCKLFECGVESLLIYEQRFIKFFKPKHNSSGVKKAGKKLTHEWVLSNAELIRTSFETSDSDILFKKARKEFGYSPKYNDRDMCWTFIRGYERALNVNWNRRKRKFETIKP